MRSALPAAQHAAAVLFSFEIQSYFSASNVYQQIYKELEAKLVKNRKVTLLLRHLDIENSRLENISQIVQIWQLW